MDFSKLQLNDFKGISDNLNNLIDGFLNESYSHTHLIVGDKQAGGVQLCHLIADYILNNSNFHDHPDKLAISLESQKQLLDKATKSLGVSVAREIIIPFISKYSKSEIARFVIIEEAELLTEEAQNALLKPIEEPKANVVFFIVCDDESKIISTIKSRCKKVHMQSWPVLNIENYILRFTKDNSLAKSIASCSNGLIISAIYYANNFDKVLENKELLIKALSIKKAYDAISFSSENAKISSETQEQLLNNIEYAIQNLLKIKSGIISDEIDYPDNWKWAIKNANYSNIANLLNIVNKSREMRKNNIGWQPCMDYMLANILEETKQWQQ